MSFKEFLIQGSLCSNCMIGIKRDLLALEYINRLSFSDDKRLIRIIYNDVREDYFSEMVKVFKKHEPSIKLLEVDSDNRISVKYNKSEFYRIITTVILLVIYLYVRSISPLSDLLVISAAYIIISYKILKSFFINSFYLKFFNENSLMSVSTVSAIIIGERFEAVVVMLLYSIGQYVESYAVKKTEKALEKIVRIKQENVHVLSSKGIFDAKPEEIAVGDIIIVKPGERIPLDGVIIEGDSTVDLSVISGESLPVHKTLGDKALSGSINLNGVLTVRVTAEDKDSTVNKIIGLIEGARSKKTDSEKFITVFAKYYTPIVFLVAVCIAFIPTLIFSSELGIREWMYRALVFLVISCPCALVISIPLAFFSGLGLAARHNILIKGGNILDAMNKVSHVIFDKTGTLTMSEFKIKKIKSENHISDEELLEYALAGEFYSNHPFATAVIQECNSRDVKLGGEIKNYIEIPGMGTKCIYKNRVLKVGNDIHTGLQKDFKKRGNDKKSLNIVFHDRFLGTIIFEDALKSDALDLITYLKKSKMKLTILTGDKKKETQKVAKSLLVDDYYTELLPDDKLRLTVKISSENQKNKKVLFVGDGINDAPSLKAADIGAAMGFKGADLALESSDLVLMSDNLKSVEKTFKIAKITRNVVIQNIAAIFFVKLLFLSLGFLGYASMWGAIFADVGISVIVIMNSFRLLKYGEID